MRGFMNQSNFIRVLLKLALSVLIIVAGIIIIIYITCDYFYWILPTGFPVQETMNTCFWIQLILIPVFVLVLVLYSRKKLK